MLYIAHRINTLEQLKSVPKDYGIEVDLRDHHDRIVMQHDPYIKPEAEDFEQLLQNYDHRLIILNVKSERIEHRVLELVQKYNVQDYFFLDSSFPMIRLLANKGESKIAVRYSEYEPIEYALAMAGRVGWAWIDCFTHLPLDESTHSALKEKFKLCLVSPELQGHPLDWIPTFAEKVSRFEMDAICTKRPDLWQAAFAQLGHTVGSSS